MGHSLRQEADAHRRFRKGKQLAASGEHGLPICYPYANNGLCATIILARLPLHQREKEMNV